VPLIPPESKAPSDDAHSTGLATRGRHGDVTALEGFLGRYEQQRRHVTLAHIRQVDQHAVGRAGSTGSTSDSAATVPCLVIAPLHADEVLPAAGRSFGIHHFQVGQTSQLISVR